MSRAVLDFLNGFIVTICDSDENLILRDGEDKMAKVIANVPNGEYCNGCRFLQQGTVWCMLFDELVEETEDYTKKIKCEQCPKS